MKKMRRLIPAIAMLLVSAVMLSTASFAWFTMSTTAKTEGMTVSAMASSSLLIVNANGLADADRLDKFMSSNGVVTFTDKGSNLNPATHYDATAHKGALGDDNQQAALTNVNKGLVYLTNTEIIDPSTGLPSGTEIYAAANTEGTYYKDYKIYLGTAGAPLEGGTLTATVTAKEAEMSTIHNAVAIDFLVADTSAGTPTYVTAGGTVWLEDAKDVNGKAATLSSDIDIPQAILQDELGQKLGDYVVVIMRVYFDGAKTITDGEGAYVRDAFMNTTELGFNVKFDFEKNS